MAGGGRASNTTNALLSPDPETLPRGDVSRPATGEYLGTKRGQGQPTVAAYASLTAGPTSHLSQRYGPAILPQELVAENGLFQPKLKLAPKSPKLTPRLDPPEVGTRQLTLCPSSTNSLEPLPNLVPSEVPASGHHVFVKWDHDAKITQIGVIPTRGSPGQGMANSSQGRKQDLGLISECTTWSWVRAPCGLREMGPPIDHLEGGNWGPKMGSFWLLEMSQNLGCSQWYISTPAWRSDPPFHTRSTRSPTMTPMHLALNDLYATRRGDDPN